MPKISVIVPVYNTEKYLHSCIDSIIAQTFTDFELLLIDDGSKDNSGKICDEYVARDPRIRVFHKENGGVSSARNLGLDNAKGEWISFVDADDRIKSDYLCSMMGVSDADLIMSSFEIINHIEEWDNCVKDTRFVRNELKFFIERFVETATLCSPWCKLFRKNLIGDLRFDNNVSFSEDTIFVFKYLCNIHSVRVVENWGYQYRRGVEESLSVKLLSIEQYCYIIQEYSKSLKLLEKEFDYDGLYTRIHNNSNQFRKCIVAIRKSNKSLFNKYNDFRHLINDENIQEILKYSNDEFKGRRRKMFDFLALNRAYLLLFFLIIIYKGYIY